LVHVDAYRLGSIAELDDMDLDSSLEQSVTVVEWGEGMAEDLDDNHLAITLIADPDRGAGGAAANFRGEVEHSGGSGGVVRAG
jgi:tRNA threonylcarbamoyladenosine biosynthesis protein TsaE